MKRYVLALTFLCGCWATERTNQLVATELACLDQPVVGVRLLSVTRGFVYWLDSQADALYRISIEGGEIETLSGAQVSNALDDEGRLAQFAIDDAGNAYWISGSRITRRGEDGTQTILRGPSLPYVGLAVIGEKLLWAERGGGEDTIYAMNTVDNSFEEVGQLLSSTKPLLLRASEEYVFAVGPQVRRFSLLGSGPSVDLPEVPVTAAGTTDLLPSHGKLYVSNGPRILRYSVEGEEDAVIVLFGGGGNIHRQMHVSEGSVEFRYSGAASASGIYSVPQSGGDPKLLYSAYDWYLADPVAYEDYVYFVEGSGVAQGSEYCIRRVRRTSP